MYCVLLSTFLVFIVATPTKGSSQEGEVCIEMSSPPTQDSQTTPEDCAQSTNISPETVATAKLNGTVQTNIEISSSSSSTTATHSSVVISDTAILQAATFLKDGLKQRSINHKVDSLSLKIYNKIFHTRYRSIPLLIALTVLIILPFFEYPSSLSISSYLVNTTLSARPQPPCGVTESFEFLALLVLAADCALRFYLAGYKQFLSKPWMITYSTLLLLSFLDIMISSLFCGVDGQANIAATVRVRRYFRPIFLIIRGRTMKKFIKAIFKTVLAISTMLLMLLIILFLFTMLGLLIFHHHADPSGNSITHNNKANLNLPRSNASEFFTSVDETMISLLVFLTTSNSPDIMTHVYSENRFAFLYFSSFLTLALFLTLSLVTAMIYAEFRGYLRHSMYHSLLRRRIGYRAAFAVLQREVKCDKVEVDLITQLLQHGSYRACLLAKMKKKLNELSDKDKRVGWNEFLVVLNLMETHDPYKVELVNSIKADKKQKETQKFSSKLVLSISKSDSEKKRWKKLYDCLPSKLQKVLLYILDNPIGIIHTISSVVIIVNVIIVAVILDMDLRKVGGNSKYSIQTWSFAFGFWYTFEFCFKLIYIIVQRTRHRELFPRQNRYCLISLKLVDMAILLTIISLTLVVFVFDVALHYWHDHYIEYFTLVQVICILILLRLFHVITFFPVASTLLRTSVDILRILLPLFGLMVVLYYEFALLGMSLFGTNYKLDNITTPRITQCNTYENLHYFAYNFHDFAAAIVVLWNLTIVNNWHVFLKAYSFATGTNWAWLYFVAWWFVSVIITLNVFLTLVIEVCVNHWENFHKELKKRHKGKYYLWRVLLPTGELEPCSSVIHGTKIYDILREELEDPSNEKLLQEINRHEFFSSQTMHDK